MRREPASIATHKPQKEDAAPTDLEVFTCALLCSSHTSLQRESTKASDPWHNRVTVAHRSTTGRGPSARANTQQGSPKSRHLASRSSFRRGRVPLHIAAVQKQPAWRQPAWRQPARRLQLQCSSRARQAVKRQCRRCPCCHGCRLRSRSRPATTCR